MQNRTMASMMMLYEANVGVLEQAIAHWRSVPV